ncbi:Imm9 family immunity protein [Gemelliphila palaticanis]|uniref:Uncharacterized protein n=1 Tax=Gemelliphila palaticanis TaxID=81950 RepID=A0ABX2T280_9BACL|nr:Imm9 family immunity protein [Gemella palaticanis]MBF0715813.1 hypothetical protein [Gemella palaticanis]NYS47743.1 hypothetical protein [Gemella palaticanis]
MVQQIEISFPSEISNLTNSEIDLKQVAVELEKIVDEIFTKIDLGGKRLNIVIMTRASDRVGASKRSSRWGDRYRLFLSIAIPNHKQSPWGLRKVEWSLWNPISESQHFYFVEDTDYLSYSTVEEYVLDMAVKALTLLLEKGVTCGGHKIKIK